MKIKAIFISLIFLVGGVFFWGLLKEKKYCNGENIYFYGVPCWPINIYSYSILEKVGVENHVVLSTKIPLFSLDDSSYWKAGPHSTLALNVNIKNKKMEVVDSFKSSLILNVSPKSNDDGVRIFFENISNNKWFLYVYEDKDFLVYEESLPASSLRYFIPKHQPINGVYMKCVKNCSMLSVYRNVFYELTFPIEWRVNYLEFQRLTESFLDSVIVNVEIKGAH